MATQIDQINELKRLNHAQARLVRAVQDLSLARSLRDIQEVVRHAAREIAGADGATFVLRDLDRCYYADEDAISPLWKGQRFPLSACVSGWVMEHAQHVVIPDIYADERVPADAYRPTFVQSLAMVPIRTEAPIGAIGTYWASHHVPAAEEVELLQALANTTAVAMENVRTQAELEQRVVERTAQLEAVNRELEAFSYSVSHDLRAPLRAISGFSEILEAELGAEATPPVRRCLDRVREGVRHMSELIEDLMGLAKLTRRPFVRASVDLAEVARQIAARLQATQPNRTLRFDIPPSLPAECDAGLTAIVLENLIGNAWKYTAKTTHAQIALAMETGADGKPVYSVRDNGVGFDPRHADKLFTPFQRLHSAADFPGTGIGLATVQRAINRHGGRIWATAKPGEGATFYFTCAA